MGKPRSFVIPGRNTNLSDYPNFRYNAYSVNQKTSDNERDARDEAKQGPKA